MAEDLKRAILHHLTYTLGKDPGHAVLSDWRQALTRAVRDRMVDPWFAATGRTYGEDLKRVYYLSMEFLIGRLLEDGLINLGLREAALEALEELGQDPAAVLADEPDAALGNGGLGRLAACFMDSLASLGVPAHGYGIRYENGIFRQRIVGGRQVEEPESWLVEPNHWEFVRAEVECPVGFGGRVEGGAWQPAEQVIARAHDIPVIGWGGRWANTLRLWESRAAHGFDLARFNRGEIAGAAEPEALARSISRVLYPDDSTEQGRALRLRQEYFFTAAALADILRRFESTHDSLDPLPSKIAIQLNDTHPALAGPEFVRLLHDERGVALEDAIALARRCLSYTNHTLLPEALERWPEGLLGALLPRHLELIGRIDEAEQRAGAGRAIRADGAVDMGALSFVMAHRVNGVSALHTDLMKETVFSDLHARYPERIVNETNGITPRRWLKGCNPRLAALVSEAAGPGWESDLSRIGALETLAGDAAFRARFMAAKRANKADLVRWIAGTRGVDVDPDALFDIQIKRIHEYKRQHLKLLEVIALWQALHEGSAPDGPPRLVLMAGKAAPSYHMAKEIIRLAGDIAAVINADPATRDRLKLLFLPDYKVTLAERLIPAADLSEQISMAGKEASGTGNMKFALNGAVTIGTLDGANVEIREHVGAENFILFGLTAPEAAARAATPGHARAAIEADPRLARALEAVERGAFSPGERGRYRGLVARLRDDDPFLVCSDFDAYWQASRAADAAFADAERWARMAVLNTARSGWVSSDRTIRGYLADIWDAAPAV